MSEIIPSPAGVAGEQVQLPGTSVNRPNDRYKLLKCTDDIPIWNVARERNCTPWPSEADESPAVVAAALWRLMKQQ